MARKKKPPEHVNHERWLVSYADFITLLFAFFTTLYAISTVDAKKMGKMVMSMKASFDSALFEAGSDRMSVMEPAGNGAAGKETSESVLPQKSSSVPSVAEKLRESIRGGADRPVEGKSLGTVRRNLESAIGAEALKERVFIRVDPRGLIVSLREGGFFPSGSDQITGEGRRLLDAIATSLTGTTNLVRVEGHTDNVPIRNSRFPSNWELSTARATAVVAYFVEKFGLPPEKLSAAGYSEYRPVADNSAEEGRSRNRRVDIVVLNPQTALLEPR